MSYLINSAFQRIEAGHGHEQGCAHRHDRLVLGRSLNWPHARPVGFHQHGVDVGQGQQAGGQVRRDAERLVALDAADDETNGVFI